MSSPKRIYGFKNHIHLFNFFVLGSKISKLLRRKSISLSKIYLLLPINRPLKSATRGRRSAPLRQLHLRSDLHYAGHLLLHEVYLIYIPSRKVLLPVLCWHCELLHLHLTVDDGQRTMNNGQCRI